MKEIFLNASQLHLEFSFLILAILLARYCLKKSSKIYNVYWLWLALPLAPIASVTIKAFELPPIFTSNTTVTSFYEIQANTPLVIEHASQQSNGTLIGPLFLLWLIGALWFFSRLVKQHVDLRQQLADDDFCQAISLSSRYPICGVADTDFSPAVYGFCKPKIYFPIALQNSLDAKQCDLIVQHEEQHIRQGHLWLNLVWDIIVCINWFNPLFYFARQAFRHDQELHCDHIVLKESQSAQQIDYGLALLSTVSATHSVSLLCSWKMFDQLEERIMNIKTKPSMLAKTLITGMLASLLFASSLYALATQETIDTDSEKSSQSVTIVKVKTDDQAQTTISTGDRTYRLENGEKFALVDGERVELSEEEVKEFEHLIEQSMRYDLASGDEKRHVFEHEHVNAFTFDHDGIVNIDEIEKFVQKHLNKEIDIHSKLNKMVVVDTDRSIEKRIKKALAKSGSANDPELQQILAELDRAKNDLKESKDRLSEQQQQAENLLDQIEALDQKK